ncbi:putative HTH-type transcriptional regulator YbbH [Streptomyces sp. RB5]|uniref:Putative HTH-type transcriptional regulator YbbH n=1 Tax=Streptomyces smaragdinus TaxID=2585196 RepID=A0A7K0CIS1_9ACTN|nr:MurR/RpiR family transcriptional regulator [Streptomyces smaragdinus]MQY13389.1 putative HTH-type transcriptional regulator YbbH [Streptomyces smaragdinus]
MDTSAGIIHSRAGILARIRGLLPTLTPAERALAELVVADPGWVAASTITDVAVRSGTSRTTVTRFCRALDLPGYAGLRLALAAESGRAGSGGWADLGADLSPDDDLRAVLDWVVRADRRVIEETAAQLDMAALKAAVAALAAARRIDVYAVSGSRSVALDLHLRLHRIGRPCFVWNDIHEALPSAVLLDERDVALGISHSGETKEVIEPVREARRGGAVTVAVTNFPRSSLAKAAELTLVTTARETTYRAGGVAARHAQMIVLDCLYIGVAQHDRVRTEQALDATRRAVEDHRYAPGSGA